MMMLFVSMPKRCKTNNECRSKQKKLYPDIFYNIYAK